MSLDGGAKRQWAPTEIFKIPFKHKKRLFQCIKHWNSLLRGALESPSSEIFETQLDNDLINLLQLTLLRAEGLD